MSNELRDDIAETVATLRSALNGEAVRIEITTAHFLGDTPSQSAAHIFTRTPSGRWKKAGPVVFANQGASRSDLLDAIVGLSKGELR